MKHRGNGQGYFVMPNHVILDEQMYYSTKRVMGAILAYRGRHDTVKSIKELAILSGCCEATVQQALEQLELLGYIRKIHRWRYSQFFSRPVFDKSAYEINRKKLVGSYTLVPRELLKADISHGAFIVAIYIYMKAGRTGRSWPSLRHTAQELDMSKATVCRALELLRRLQLLVRLWCQKANHALACNSYYPTAWVRPGKSGTPSLSLFADTGGLIFDNHKVINKITEGFYFKEEDKGVGQFGNLYSFLKDLPYSGTSLPGSDVLEQRTILENDRGSLPFWRFRSAPARP